MVNTVTKAPKNKKIKLENSETSLEEWEGFRQAQMMPREKEINW